MKRFELWLVSVAVALIIFPAPVFAEDYYRPVRKSFFTVNPSLRADVLARQAVEQDDSPLQTAFDPVSSLAVEAEERKAQNGGKWNEIGMLGLQMSLSRFAVEQDFSRGGRSANDDLLLPDFRSIFLSGSLGKDDMEALGEFFRPQLNLGIEF